MSIEDRDWYREEFKGKQGRGQSLKKENKPQNNSESINEFLANERERDRKVRDSYYNPKEFRVDRVNSRRLRDSKIPNSVNKREKIGAVKITPKISIVKAGFICICLMFLTFSTTMLVIAAKPAILNDSYLIALKVADHFKRRL